MNKRTAAAAAAEKGIVVAVSRRCCCPGRCGSDQEDQRYHKAENQRKPRLSCQDLPPLTLNDMGNYLEADVLANPRLPDAPLLQNTKSIASEPCHFGGMRTVSDRHEAEEQNSSPQ